MTALAAARAVLRDLSLRWKLFWGVALFFTLLVVVSGAFSYTVALGQVEARQRLILLQNLRQAATLVDFNLNLYERRTEILASNSALQDALAAPYQDFTTRYAGYQQITRILEPVVQDLIFSSSQPSTVGNVPVDVVIYSTNPTLAREAGIIRPVDEVANEAWVRRLYEGGGAVWRGPFTEYGQTYLSVSRRLRSARTLQDLGILTILIPQARIGGLLSGNNSLVAGDIYLLVDESSSIHMSSDRTPLAPAAAPVLQAAVAGAGEGVADTGAGADRYLLARTSVGATGWTLAAILPYTAITEAVASIRYGMLPILAVGVVLCVLFTYFIAAATTRRLNAITRKMNRLRANWKAPLEVIPGRDEVGQLDVALNELVTNLNQVTEEELRLRLQRASLQVELLQAQINPHLLYNTLATINWRSRKVQAWDIAEATDALIRFFRRFLNRGEALSTFAAELEIVRENLRILKFTYNLTFDELFEVEPAILSYPALHLMLQPIAENAVVHGIRPAGQPGVLAVRGCLQDGVIRFEIADNGVGMPPEMVDLLNGEAPSDATASSPMPGFGLLNVQKRVRLYFGPGYGLRVQSTPARGATVTLTVPALTREELQNRLRGPIAA